MGRPKGWGSGQTGRPVMRSPGRRPVRRCGAASSSPGRRRSSAATARALLPNPLRVPSRPFPPAITRWPNTLGPIAHHNGRKEC